MSELKLVAEAREEVGKSVAGRLRREGKVPGILYGELKNPIPIALNEHDLTLGLREHYSIVNLAINGKSYRCIVREVQYHPVTGRILHVDFMGIKANQAVEMEVPIEFEGSPAGVKEGGIFDEIKHVATILVLPKNIPDVIRVNVEDLKIGDALRLKDLQNDKYEILGDPEDVICRVEAPHGAEVTEVAEGEEEETAEPEVISKGKESKEEEE